MTQLKKREERIPGSQAACAKVLRVRVHLKKFNKRFLVDD